MNAFIACMHSPGESLVSVICVFLVYIVIIFKLYSAQRGHLFANKYCLSFCHRLVPRFLANWAQTCEHCMPFFNEKYDRRYLPVTVSKEN